MNAPRRWLASAGFALAGLLVAAAMLEPRLTPPGRDAAILRPGLPEAAPRSYRQALATADAEVAGARAIAAAQPNDWLPQEALSRRLAARARLTGSFDDYAAAQAALDRAFAVAAPGAGPHLAQATLHFSLHRLDAAERQLDLIDRYAVPPDLIDRVEALALRGDIAFYRGDIEGAARLYRRAEAVEPGAGALAYRWAIYHARTGRPDLAEAAFDRAIRASEAPLPQFRANVELQKGILYLERGRYAEAMARFRKADAIFPGHWLIEEHIAEVLALTGRPAEAERLYVDIVRRTGHPEFMDQLAGIAEARGDAAAAQAWRARAGREWERRLSMLPQAAYGHALDHFLSAGDPTRALAIARANHAARPHGEAKVALAQALLAAGERQAARDVIVQVLRSRWRTPDTHAVAAQVFEANGLHALARRERLRAAALERRPFG